jgi:hypothetical protein
MHDEGDNTRVTVTTDLNITGRPAQFGRGVMVEVGNKLLGRFADCLAEEIGGGSAPEPTPAPTPEATPTSTAATSTSPASDPTPIRPEVRPRAPEDEAIDLLDTAGLPVLKRLLPVLGSLLVVVVLWRLLRRR